MKNVIKQSSEVEFNKNDFLEIDSKWLNRIKKLAKKNKSNKWKRNTFQHRQKLKGKEKNRKTS